MSTSGDALSFFTLRLLLESFVSGCLHFHALLLQVVRQV